MKAMILAAGRGTRMKALTESTPKPLLPVAGQPLIYYHLKRLFEAGFTEVVVNVSHLANQMIQYFDADPVPGLTIQVSVEAEPLETAGGIIKALPYLGDQPFVCINGDVWTDYPFEQLKNFKKQNSAYLVLVENPTHHPEGDFGLQGGDKNAVNQCVLSPPKYTFSGISLLDPALLMNYRSEQGRLGEVLKQAMADDKVFGSLYEGIWLDVGTPERLAEANRMATVHSSRN